VSRYGVFVIETKNMKGWIFGDPQQKTWTQKIYRHTTKFQNPLLQNYNISNSYTVSDEFVFITPIVSTADFLIPHLVHSDAFDITKGIAGNKPTKDWLAILSGLLLKDVDTKAFSLNITARLRLPLAGSINYFVPLPSLLAVKFGLDWVSSLAGYIDQSFERLDSIARSNGFLELKIQVFRAGSEVVNKPVLSFKCLELPLAKITQTDLLFVIHSHRDNQQVQLWQVAAFVYDQIIGISGETSEIDSARVALTRFALSGRLESLINVCSPPELSQLDSPVAANEWAICNKLAAELQAGVDSAPIYLDLAFSPVDEANGQPLKNNIPWIMTSLFDNVEKVAGPFREIRSSIEIDIFLWGLRGVLKPSRL
jgi:hypothetical protein